MTIPNELWLDDNDALECPPRREMAFRLLVDTVEDYAIFLLSTDGRVLTWNRGAERIKGYSADEIVGQHFSVFYTPEEREAGRPMSLLGQAADVAGSRTRAGGSARTGRGSGPTSSSPPCTTNGVPYAYAKVTRDLTERRAAEEPRRQLLAEQRARAAAEEALIARERFLSIASHELKTPVASLRLSAEALLHAKAADRLDEERLQAGLDRILTSSQRLGALVEELLDISRLTAGVLPIHPTATDLVGIASDVIARFVDAGVGDRIRLIAGSPVVIEADPSRIDQVMTNLIDNALKYSEPPSEVEVTISERPDVVEITVADRGMGIDEVTAGRLFEAFGRGDAVEHVPGLGLGLHITHQIVELHGGTITAASRTDGAGALVTVRLPRTRAAST